MTDALPTLHALADGRPALRVDDRDIPLSVHRCFPWSHPDRYLTLRDADGKERALIRDPADLDPDSRAVLEAEMARSDAHFQVTALQSVTKELELRCWEVETRGGPRQFQTELDEWPRALPDGSLLVEDLYGDLYRIPPPATLDPKSRARIWPLLG